MRKKKEPTFAYGIEITKPFSKEMYDHNDMVAKEMKENILKQWNALIHGIDMDIAWEDFGDGPVIIYDSFKDFSTPQDCVDDLVTKWYHDYKGYIGVNRQPNREAAAYHLKAEGYATDPAYPQKLIRLMDMNA